MKKLSTGVMSKNRGFTLIELVIVIVILGILAATAAPKFIDLQDDAQTATMEAIKASMESASTLVHAKALIANELGAGDSVNVNGASMNVEFGYPEATTAAWGNLLELATADFTTILISGTPDSVLVYRTGTSPVPTAITDACVAFFTEAANATTPPVINSVAC